MRYPFSRIDRSVLIRSVGLSRHSLLPVMRLVSAAPPRSMAVRISSLGVGSTMIGFSVALLVQANLGLAPYDVLASGVGDHLGISLGQAGWAIAAALFLTASTLGRSPSIWGMGYVFANGLTIDAASGLLNAPPTVMGRLLFVGMGVVLMASGINMVVHSGTTGGPFELLMLAAEDRGVSRTQTRYALEFGVLALGVGLGGAFGVATVAYAATMGVVLHVIGQVFADHRAGRRRRLEPPAAQDQLERSDSMESLAVPVS